MVHVHVATCNNFHTLHKNDTRLQVQYNFLCQETSEKLREYIDIFFQANTTSYIHAQSVKSWQIP